VSAAREGWGVSERFLFLIGSARVGGNSERLARYAAAGLPALHRAHGFFVDMVASGRVTRT